MTTLPQMAKDYRKVEQTIVYWESRFADQLQPADIAAAVGLSAIEFQRLLVRWAGISPQHFMRYLTKEYGKNLLRGPGNLREASLDAGLCGPDRRYDVTMRGEAVTPGRLHNRGSGLDIVCGFHPSPFGECLIARTAKGICHLGFVQAANRQALMDGFKRFWPAAAITFDRQQTAPLVEPIFALSPVPPTAPLHLFVQGTPFQIRVWDALIRIPLGAAVTYQDLALAIGSPAAARAVGNAVGSNPVSFLIPCHRVIRKGGDFGHYGGGRARKKAILVWEAAMLEKRRGAPV
jgi:AraC family transcriptional regulator of adaptative response/methylated-DNA-[protein]-cysteine methyltransferase